jgi:hypothetical protein
MVSQSDFLSPIVKQVTHADALADKMLHNAQVAASTRRTAVLERHLQWQQWAATSTGRRNTLGELLCWSLILQGLAGPFVELPCDCAEFCLGMDR